MTSKAYDARGQFARAGDVFVKLEAPPQLLREHAFYGSAAEARVYISDTIWLAVGVVTMRPVKEGGPCTLGMRWPDGVHVDDQESRKAIWEKIQATYHQTMAGAADWEPAKVEDWKKARGFTGPPGGGGGARVKSNAEREAERQAKQREAEAQAEQRRKEAEDRKRQAEDAKAKGERMHQEGARRAGQQKQEYTYDEFFRTEDFFDFGSFDGLFNRRKRTATPPPPPPPPPGKPEGWPWNVLGFAGPVYDEAVLRKAYHRAARDAHPDHGGSTAKMQEVNVAHDECRHLAGIDKCGKGIKGCKLKHCAE